MITVQTNKDIDEKKTYKINVTYDYIVFKNTKWFEIKDDNTNIKHEDFDKVYEIITNKNHKVKKMYPKDVIIHRKDSKQLFFGEYLDMMFSYEQVSDCYYDSYNPEIILSEIGNILVLDFN